MKSNMATDPRAPTVLNLLQVEILVTRFTWVGLLQLPVKFGVHDASIRLF